MPLRQNRPYVKWSDRKELERLAAISSSRPKRPRGRPRKVVAPIVKLRKPRAPRVSAPCPGCGTYGKPGRKFCSLSCSGKAARRGQLAWEKSIADDLVGQGWSIMSPTACCDRIGIKDGKLYFLEFKPEGVTALRSFQKAVQALAPRMYRVVEGDRLGKVSV
jgi:hypothetical protein